MTDSIDRGIALLQAAVRAKPDDPEICMNLMFAWCRKSQPHEAVSQYVTFVKSCPQPTQLHHDMLLNAGRNQGFANEIFQGFQQTVKQPPNADTYLVQYGLGLLLTSLGMHDLAIPAFEESIRQNADFAPAYHNLGLARQFSADLLHEPERADRQARAIHACLTATRKNPTLAEPHYFWGVMKMNDADPIPAMLHFVEFVRLADSYLANHVPMAKTSIQMLRARIRETEERCEMG